MCTIFAKETSCHRCFTMKVYECKFSHVGDMTNQSENHHHTVTAGLGAGHHECTDGHMKSV